MPLQNQPAFFRDSAFSPLKSFSIVLVIEFWERFGYYGMQSLFLFFLVQHQQLGDEKANMLWGAFFAVMCATKLCGGWVGDALLGTRRSVMLGMVVLAIGYALLAIPDGTGLPFYLALALLCLGNGFFGPNSANLVRMSYEHDRKKTDAVFTIYYMVVNIGSSVTILVVPWVRSLYGWYMGFLCSSISLVLAALIFWLFRKWTAPIGSPPDFRPLPFWGVCKLAAGSCAIVLSGVLLLKYPVFSGVFILASALGIAVSWGWLMLKAAGNERYRFKIAFTLILECILFFIFYQQTATSLNLFTLRHVQGDFFLFHVGVLHWSAPQFQALNPLWIMLLSPFLARLYHWLEQHDKPVSLESKFFVGFLCVAVGFLYWWWTTGAGQVQLSAWVMVVGYGFLALGELLISGLGLTIIARYAPSPTMSGYMIGSYGVLMGVSGYVGSLVANHAAVMGGASPLESLAMYHRLFGWLVGCAALVCCGVVGGLQRVIDKWKKALSG